MEPLRQCGAFTVMRLSTKNLTTLCTFYPFQPLSQPSEFLAFSNQEFIFNNDISLRERRRRKKNLPFIASFLFLILFAFSPFSSTFFYTSLYMCYIFPLGFFVFFRFAIVLYVILQRVTSFNFISSHHQNIIFLLLLLLLLTNSMAYGTRKFNAALTRALQ